MMIKCQQQQVIKKSMWKPEEDMILKRYVEAHGEGNWSAISKKSGLMRGAKSCRMRWKNYLRPDIKHGRISKDEEDLIIRMHKLLGNRWALIAGRLPGRTDNEVKNYWNTHLNKKVSRRRSRLISKKGNKSSSSPISPSQSPSAVVLPKINHGTTTTTTTTTTTNNNNNIIDQYQSLGSGDDNYEKDVAAADMYLSRCRPTTSTTLCCEDDQLVMSFKPAVVMDDDHQIQTQFGNDDIITKSAADIVNVDRNLVSSDDYHHDQYYWNLIPEDSDVLLGSPILISSSNTNINDINTITNTFDHHQHHHYHDGFYFYDQGGDGGDGDGPAGAAADCCFMMSAY